MESLVLSSSGQKGRNAEGAAGRRVLLGDKRTNAPRVVNMLKYKT